MYRNLQELSMYYMYYNITVSEQFSYNTRTAYKTWRHTYMGASLWRHCNNLPIGESDIQFNLQVIQCISTQALTNSGKMGQLQG